MDPINSLISFFGLGGSSKEEEDKKKNTLTSYFNTPASTPKESVFNKDKFEQRGKVSRDAITSFLRAWPRELLSIDATLSGKPFVPTTKFQKAILGEETIGDVGKEVGNPLLSSFGVNTETPGGKAAGLLVGGILAPLDFVFGGESKILTNAAKAIGATQDATKIFNEAKKLGISDSIITRNSDALIKANESEAKSLLKNMGEEHNALVKNTDISNPKDPFYNLNRLEIPNEQKAVIKSEIEKAKPEFEKVHGAPLTHKEVIKRARETGRVLEETVTREDTAEAIASNLNLRNEIARVGKTGSVDKQFIEAIIRDKAAGANVARQLEARKIVATGEESAIIQQVIDAIHKTGKTADEIAEAAKGVDFNDANQLTAFYRKYVAPKASEWIDTLRYNSMLSSPKTHFKNIFSNLVGSFIVKPLHILGTAGVDAIHHALGGPKRTYFASEAGKYLKGATKLEAFKKAKKDFFDVMSGKTSIKNIDIKRVGLATSGKARTVEKILSYPTKLMEAADRYFTALIESGVDEQLRHRMKMQGKEITTSILNKIKTEAEYQAEKGLFRGEMVDKKNGPVINALGKFAGLIEMARQSDNPILSTVAKFTFPFVRTGTNIIATGLEWNPLTGWTTVIGVERKAEQIAKVAMGTAATLGVATLIGSDRLTFKEPTDPTQKAAFRADGRKPYSVFINGKWYSYQYLHPAISFNLALASAIDQKLKEKTISETKAEAILSAVPYYLNFISDQSFVKNIGDFVNGFQGDPEGFTKMLSNYPSQLIPFRAMLSWVEKLTDPIQRKADSEASAIGRQLQQIALQIPGLAQKVPARLGPDGTPIKNTNRLLNALSPVDVGTETAKQRLEYQKYERARIANKNANISTKELKNDIGKMVDGLSGHSLTEKKEIIADFLDTHTQIGADKMVVDAIKDKAKAKAYTSAEKAMLSMGVTNGARAQFILDELRNTPNTERKAFLENLVKKKILTKEVISQIATLSQQE